MREHERTSTLRFLDALVCYDLETAVADYAGSVIRQYREKGITLDAPDAVIAATALHYGLVLLTYNPQHFPMPELQRYPSMPALS